MILHWVSIVLKGTTAVRKGRAVATTTRLMTLLRMTAPHAPNPNRPMRSGKRHAAPPSPRSPLSVPMTAPPLHTAHALPV